MTVSSRVGIGHVLAGAILAAIVAGCSTSQQVKVKGDPSEYCPFLGAETCHKLVATETPGRFGGGSGMAGLRYVNPNANWTQYHKVMIAPVSFWGGDDTSVSQADQLALTNFFTQSLNEEFKKKFTVVNSPGPGVLLLQVAIDDVTKAVPVLRSVSMVIPQARVLATLKYVATGTYAFVGSAQAEAKVSDSMTGEVLAAAVDRRVGGGNIKTAAQWQMGDAENAMKEWSRQAAERLSAWTSGTAPSAS
jgi:hypothetical protein